MKSMITRSYVTEKKFVYVLCSGSINNDDIQKHIQALDNEALCNSSGVLELFEFAPESELNEHRTSDATDAADTNLGNVRHQNGKMAILVHSDLQYGISRAYQTFALDDERDIQIFNQLREALFFLCLHEDEEIAGVINQARTSTNYSSS